MGEEEGDSPSFGGVRRKYQAEALRKGAKGVVTQVVIDTDATSVDEADGNGSKEEKHKGAKRVVYDDLARMVKGLDTDVAKEVFVRYKRWAEETARNGFEFDKKMVTEQMGRDRGEGVVVHRPSGIRIELNGKNQAGNRSASSSKSFESLERDD